MSSALALMGLSLQQLLNGLRVEICGSDGLVSAHGILVALDSVRMKAIVIEGVLVVESETGKGHVTASEKYVRLLPGWLAYWADARPPQAGEAPEQLFLLEGLELKLEADGIRFNSEAATLKLMASRSEVLRWRRAIEAQYVFFEDVSVSQHSHAVASRFSSRQESRRFAWTRSQSVPPQKGRARPKHKEDAAALLRSSNTKRKVLAFDHPELGFSLELIKASATATRLVVRRVSDKCVHRDRLTPGDSLVAINGAVVPERFLEESFYSLLERLAAADRPMRLTFESKELPSVSKRTTNSPSHAPSIQGKARSYRRLESGPSPFARKEYKAEQPPLLHMSDFLYYELKFASRKFGFVLARESCHGLPAISGVRETCEHKSCIAIRDELVALDGVDIPVPLTHQSFDALLKIMRASKRPLTLTLRRKVALATGTVGQEMPVRSDTKSVDSVTHTRLRGTDAAELTWRNFVLKHATWCP